MIDRIRLQSVLTRSLNLPYGFGHKWDLQSIDPQTPIDCSGFTRWSWYQGCGITVPDGSYMQWKAARPLKPDEPILIGDVGFFQNDKGEIHHVGLIFDESNVIEARGHFIDRNGLDIGEKVLFRPRASWEAWGEFKAAGGWHRFLAVDQAE